MKRVNLWVYGIAAVSSFVNIFLSHHFFEMVAWSCSAVWSVSALMLQIRVNELENENLDLFIENEVNSVKSDSDEKE